MPQSCEQCPSAFLTWNLRKCDNPHGLGPTNRWSFYGSSVLGCCPVSCTGQLHRPPDPRSMQAGSLLSSKSFVTDCLLLVDICPQRAHRSWQLCCWRTVRSEAPGGRTGEMGYICPIVRQAQTRRPSGRSLPALHLATLSAPALPACGTWAPLHIRNILLGSEGTCHLHLNMLFSAHITFWEGICSLGFSLGCEN